MTNHSDNDRYYRRSSSEEAKQNYYQDNHTEVGDLGESSTGKSPTRQRVKSSNKVSNTRSSDTYSKQSNQAYKIPPKKKKKKSHWKKGLALLIIAGLLIFLFFNPIFSFPSLFYGGPVYPEKAGFTIERTLRVNSNRRISYSIDTPVPLDIPGNDIQRIDSIDWSVSPPQTVEKYGQDWKVWEGELTGTKEIEITYRVRTETIDWKYDEEDSGIVPDIRQDLKDRYNHNQWLVDQDRDGDPDDRDSDGRGDWMIEPDSNTIQNLAEDITEDKTSLYDKSKAIYEWLNDNIEYERGGSGLPKHALWTLSSGKGDCDEQSFLFCSLARSIGIPAWVELGVLYDRVIDEWGGHGWIRMEFLTTSGDTGWVNIDPVNHQFFARDATRFTSWVDDGIQGHLRDYYLFLNYTYSSLGGSPQVTISDEYVNLEMDEEGEVYLGDDRNSIPGFEFILLAPIMLTSILIYDQVKKNKENK